MIHLPRDHPKIQPGAPRRIHPWWGGLLVGFLVWFSSHFFVGPPKNPKSLGIGNGWKWLLNITIFLANWKNWLFGGWGVRTIFISKILAKNDLAFADRSITFEALCAAPLESGESTGLEPLWVLKLWVIRIFWMEFIQLVEHVRENWGQSVGAIPQTRPALPAAPPSNFKEADIKLGDGFKYFLFSPLLGEMIQIDEYFSSGLKPPTSKVVIILYYFMVEDISLSIAATPCKVQQLRVLGCPSCPTSCRFWLHPLSMEFAVAVYEIWSQHDAI